jgi:hypothetical protein
MEISGQQYFKSATQSWTVDPPPGAKPEGAIALANAISDMGALSVLSLKSKSLGADGGKALAEGLKGNSVITQLSLADNQLTNYGRDMSGIIALADALPDMGALSVANVMGNKIGKEQLSKLQEIMRAKPNFVSLCGIADDATEADLSGLGMDADDAIVLASELPDKGALSSLKFASNNIGGFVNRRGFHATPEGKHGIFFRSRQPLILDIRRSCCCSCCHQGYGGYDEPQSFRQLLRP